MISLRSFNKVLYFNFGVSNYNSPLVFKLRTVLTCELMIRQSNAKYDAMVAAGRYTSATTENPDEQTMAHGYIAAMNAAVETLKQVAFDEKSKRGTSNGSSGSGKCKKCNKEGHRAADCPTVDTGATSATTITINGKEEPFQGVKWKTIKPTDVKEKIKFGRTIYRYCETCVRWMYHDKGHHAAWLVRKNAKENNSTGSTNDGSTGDSTNASNNGNNGRTLVAIGNEIDQDFLFGRETIREDSF